MSINQAAINYSLPYSSLYGRFKRGLSKYDSELLDHSLDGNSQLDSQNMLVEYQNQEMQHYHQHQSNS